jgi:hypothetical protein
MTNQATKSSSAPKFCIKCVHFHYLGVMRDEQFFCGARASRDVVTGKPMRNGSITCYAARATGALCGPDAVLFERELPALGVNRIFNPADLPVNGHGVNETCQQDGIDLGIAIAQNCVDLGDSNTQVSPDVDPAL